MTAAHRRERRLRESPTWDGISFDDSPRSQTIARLSFLDGHESGRRHERRLLLPLIAALIVALAVVGTARAQTVRRAPERSTAPAGGSSAVQMPAEPPELQGMNPSVGTFSPGPWPMLPVVRLPPTPRPTVLVGSASWYCLAGRSRCTAGYPGGMYAAIRRDLLGHRGERARVCAGERCVVVTIVDCLCSGGPGVVDLYSAAFARLAPLGTGRIAVTLEWL